jgi:class 3 adenylate cyclase
MGAALAARTSAPTLTALLGALESTGAPGSAKGYVVGIVPVLHVARSPTLRCAGIVTTVDGQRRERLIGAPSNAGCSNAGLGVSTAALPAPASANVSSASAAVLFSAGGVYPLWSLLTLSAPPVNAPFSCAARRAHTAFLCSACSGRDAHVRMLLSVAGATPLTNRDCEAAIAASNAQQCVGDELGVLKTESTVPAAASFSGTAWTMAYNHEFSAGEYDYVRFVSTAAPSAAAANDTNPVSTSLNEAAVALSAELPLALVQSGADVTATQPASAGGDAASEPLPITRVTLGATVFAVIANLPSVRGALRIPACEVLAMFNGTSSTWDRVSDANAFVSIPRGVAVSPVRTADGELNRAAAAQLVRLAPLCGAVDSTVRSIDSGLASASMTEATRWSIVSRVGQVEGSIAMVPIDSSDSLSAFATLGIVVVEIIDPRTGWSTHPGGATAHLNALASSLSASSRFASSSAADRRGAAAAASWTAVAPEGVYPFVGAVDAVFLAKPDSAVVGSCASYADSLRFLRFVADNARAIAAPQPDAFALDADWLAAAGAALDGAMCGGARVFPEEASKSLATIVVAVTVPIGLLTVVVLSFGIMQWFKSATRDTGNAPKKPPFAIVFTDIQSSTALWALQPDIMGDAVDAHHAIIRRVIRRHRCYEVKTIGDSFMIVTESVPTAVKVAADIQKKLFEYDWGTSQIDRTYRELLEDSLSAMPGAPTQTYRRLWNGLRVRIGIDYGDGQVRFDNVSKGFDYYGTSVNAAARIEALGHGGQILASEEVMVQLTESFLREEKVCVDYLGTHLLRGLVDPVNLFMLTPKRFYGREYDELRLEQGGAARTQDLGFGQKQQHQDADPLQHIPEQDRHYYVQHEGPQHGHGSSASFDSESASSRSSRSRRDASHLAAPTGRRKIASRQQAYRRGSTISNDVDDDQPVPYEVPAAFGGGRNFSPAAGPPTMPGANAELSGTLPPPILANAHQHANDAGTSAKLRSFTDDLFDKLTTVFGPLRAAARTQILTVLSKEWQVPADDDGMSSHGAAENGQQQPQRFNSSSSAGYVPSGTSVNSDTTASARKREAFAMEAESSQQLRLLCSHIAKNVVGRGSKRGSRRASVASASAISDIG